MESLQVDGENKSAKNNDAWGSKCVSKTCSFPGINPNNKLAVATCHKCGNPEHFSCEKISPEQKSEVINGTSKYSCSECFANEPSIGLVEKKMIGSNLRRARYGSIPLLGQGYVNQKKKN